MDLSSLSLTELQTLQKQVEAELQTKQQQSMHDARQQILAIASQVGLPLNQLLADVASKPTRTKSHQPVPVRYRHPEQPSLQWTGRGRAPAWVVAWEQEHGSRNGLRVKAE